MPKKFFLLSLISFAAVLFGMTSPGYSAAVQGAAPSAPSASFGVPSGMQGGMQGTSGAGVTTTITTSTVSTNEPRFENYLNRSENYNPELYFLNEFQSADKPLTEAEVNKLFNDILGEGKGGSFRKLFQNLPRYGMSFFRNPPSTYAPVDSVPVTQDYRISVGDEMMLSVWGIPEEGNYSFVVGRDGTVRLPHVGSVRVAGYTFAEAERILSSQIDRYYSGYQMHLSMGRLSSIMVYVTGNVQRPGAYTISSFSTLVNALIASGGPSNNGTLRRIELKRGGKTVALFDMYAMLMKGDKTQDVRLQTGDVIYIPPVGALVGVAGEIQQPGIYELNGSTKVSDLLYTAGGLNAGTFKGRIQYYRIIDNAYASAIEGTIAEFENTKLKDGDILRLYPVFNFTSTVLISGPLFNPGTYAVVPGKTKITEIIRRGGGLMTTASNRAIVTRVTHSAAGLAHERFNVDLEKAFNGDPENNIVLEANDKITVMVIPEWQTQIKVDIRGEVKCPGTYYMFPGEKLSDLIENAEGFTPKAFLRGAIFTRKSTAAQQKAALNSMADQLEVDLLQVMQTQTAEDEKAATAEYQRRRDLINRLRNIDIMGRVITAIDTPNNIRETEWDYTLQDGDALYIPERPLTVNVMGAVYSPSSQTYRSKMSLNAYINASGGPIKTAHKRMVYLIKGDGTTVKLTRSTSMLSSKNWKAPRGFSAKIEPGDTIVVPVKYNDRQSMENLSAAVDIIYKVAVSVGVLLKN